MSYNLGDKSPEEREKVNLDLAASGVAYKERMNLPVIPVQVVSGSLKASASISVNACSNIAIYLSSFPGKHFTQWRISN